jgi:predicted translin family RNA/ssDNA-binding protein
MAGAAMRQSDFDKISTALDRAEFAIEELRKKLDELHRWRAVAKTLEEIAVINVEANVLLQLLRKISDAVHTSNPAPHLWLISDIDE